MAAYDNPQVAAEMLVQSALDAGGNDNVTAIVLDLRDDSANNAADTATNTTVDIDWNVSKIRDHEDIGDLQEGTLQTLRTIPMTRMFPQWQSSTIRLTTLLSAHSIQYLQNTR